MGERVILGAVLISLFMYNYTNTSRGRTPVRPEVMYYNSPGMRKGGVPYLNCVCIVLYINRDFDGKTVNFALLLSYFVLQLYLSRLFWQLL